MSSDPYQPHVNLTFTPNPFNETANMTVNFTGPAVSGLENGIPGSIAGILAGLIVPHAVCTVFILARIWSRLFFLRKWFIDDSLIVLAWAASSAVCVMYVFATQTPDIEDAVVISSGGISAGAVGVTNTDPIQAYVLRTYLGLIFYQFCLLLTKLSILAFYVRMFKSRPTERRLAWATVTFVLLYGIPLLLMSGFQCHPLVSDYSIPGLKCFDFFPLLIASAVLHTVVDAWLIILVVPCIARLDLPRRQKVALGFVLSLSIFVIAAAMIRLQLSLHANYRPSGDGVQVCSTLMFFIMTILESDIALICASAPTLRPLLARLMPKWESRSSARRASGTGAGNGNAGGSGGDNSMNLTAVSYHGYPWTQPPTPQSRSKNASQAEFTNEKAASPADLEKQEVILPDPGPALQRPPPTATTQRRPPPTAMGLRSLITHFTARRRSTADSANRHSRHSTRQSTRLTDRSAPRSASDAGDQASLISKASLLGFERYFEQQAGEEQRKSKAAASAAAAGAGRRLSGGGGGSSWTASNNSQESFVMGENDPASPSRISSKRLSPLSPASATSGTTLGTGGPARALTDLERREESVAEHEGET